MSNHNTIFACQDINWQGLEELFQEMSGKKPENPHREISLPDLAMVWEHVQSCQNNCWERLREIIERYPIIEHEITTIIKERK